MILGEIGLSEIIKDKEMNKSNSIYYPIEYHTADQNFKFETSFDIWYFLFLNWMFLNQQRLKRIFSISRSLGCVLYEISKKNTKFANIEEILEWKGMHYDTSESDEKVAWIGKYASFFTTESYYSKWKLNI